MDRLNRYLRENIKSILPYSSARDEFVVDDNKKNELILLDANENSLGSILGEGLNRYPDPLQRQLKAELGGVMSVNPDFMFLSNGSDEAIDYLIRVFCDPSQDEIIVMPPTFPMYKVSAAINSVRVKEVPLDSNFQINLKEVKEAFSEKCKLLFICSPNNPTANLMKREDVVSLIKDFPGYVVVDEAYIDFCPEDSVLPLINEFDNLIILRTFSKAWGLAGIRLGITIAQKELISALNKIKPPYNINSLTERAARKALRLEKQKRKFSNIIIDERERVLSLLRSCKKVERVYPSDTNFLLVKFYDALKVYEKLKNASIIVRNQSSVPALKNCLRITIGKKEENDKFIKVIFDEIS